MAALGQAEEGGQVGVGGLGIFKEGGLSDKGRPGRCSSLVLQHDLWEPQHVRGQAQDADVPKIIGIPLQPAVHPALEADRNVRGGFCYCPGPFTAPNFPEGR